MRKLILLARPACSPPHAWTKITIWESIDTDNIAIGDEGSQFRIPLVKVLVRRTRSK